MSADSGYYGEPVNTATGNYVYEHQDIRLGDGRLGIAFTRDYNSLDSYTGPFGNGWTHAYNMFLNLQNPGTVTVKYGDGHEETYLLQPDGTFIPNSTRIYSQLVKKVDGSYTLTNKKQTRYLFDSAGRLLAVVDRNGNTVSLNYTGDALTAIIDPVGRVLTLSYDSNRHIVQISYSVSRVVSYSYDQNGNLITFTDAVGGVWTYQYNSLNQLTGIIKPRGNSLVTNVYSNGQVVSQNDGLGQTTLFEYHGYALITDVNGNMLQQYFDPMTHQLTWDGDAFRNFIVYQYDDNGNRIQVQDRNYNVTKYTYDLKGNILTKTDPAQNVTTNTYDSLNNLLTRTDALDNLVSFTYDSHGNITSVTDQLGKVTSFTYDNLGNILTMTDANNQVWNFSYDSSGNMIQAKDPLNHSKSFTYDGAGRKISESDGNSNVTSYAYDGNDNLLSVTDVLGNSTVLAHDANGNIGSYKDKNGNTSTYTYDANDRLISTADPLGNVTSYEYDSMGKKTKETDQLGNVTKYNYNMLGNCTSVEDPLGNVTGYTYDNNGNLLSIQNPSNETTTFVYDQLDRVISIIAPYSYSVSRAYDALGRLTSSFDANGGRTEYGYNPVGRVVQVLEAGSQAPTVYAYDAVGNMTSVTDALGNVTSYTYDAANRRITETEQASGGKSYTYDGAGNVVAMQKQDGVVISYGYDAVNHLVQVSSLAGPSISFNYDGNGNRISMSDSLGGSAWTYDALNRMLSYTGPFGKMVGYGYDAKGNRTQIIYPGDLVVSYGYDSDGRLVSVLDWLGNTTTYSYDAVGRPTLVTNPNGTTTSYEYDFGYRLSALSNHQSDGTVINGYAYTLDGLGNQVDVVQQEPLTSAFTPPLTAYGYGPANRITTAGTVAYTHDANGNRTGQTGDNAATFAYDYLNRLSAVSGNASLAYRYDGLGNRLGRVENSSETRYVLDPNGSLPNVIAEANAAGELQACYIYGLGLLYKIAGNGSAYAYHFDSRGSTIAMSDPTGQLVNRYSYGPFGETIGIVEEVSNPFGYVGKYGVMEEGNGLKYMRARYYDPRVGRFITEDPLGFGGGDVNLFAYVRDNPVNWIDPLGLTQRDIDVAIALARLTQIDLSFPADNQYFVKPASDMGIIHPATGKPPSAYTDATGTYLNADKYLPELDEEKATALLDTIIHEGIHWTLPWDDPNQDDLAGKGYPYQETKRRMKPDLIDQYLKKRKEKPTCQ